MARYETLVLVRTEATPDELAFLEKSFQDLVAKAKGTITSFDKWGKHRLAYTVQKQDFGIYILVRYEVDLSASDALMQDLKMFFRVKVSDFVMRHVNIRIADDATSNYLKPEPVESGRLVGQADAFLKENKMRSGFKQARGISIGIEGDQSAHGPRLASVEGIETMGAAERASEEWSAIESATESPVNSQAQA